MYALGPGANAAITGAIGPYYAFAGPGWIEDGIAAALTAPDRIRAAVADFERAGCDELIFTANDPDPGQDALADCLPGG